MEVDFPFKMLEAGVPALGKKTRGRLPSTLHQKDKLCGRSTEIY